MHLGLDSSYKWSSDNMSNNADATAWCRYSVFGGYSAGSAKDNIVVVNSVLMEMFVAALNSKIS